MVLLLRQMTHFFALLLWVAAGLAALAGMPQLALAIVVVVVLNASFAFVQEYRADRAVDRLRDLLPETVLVIRDGQRHRVGASSLVPADLVVLEAGDKISADLTVHIAHSLAVDESILTGESVPRRVSAGDDMYAGTFVTEGTAVAEVTATGDRTRIAGIARLTRQVKRPPGPLAIRLKRVVRTIGLIAVGVGVSLFFAGLLLGLTALEAFLLALGATVALVPEGLLPTVTLALALGARRMAARKALVRRLEAVETLGSVTFICTDKTGTLTRNEMAVVEVWTPAGTASVAGVGYEPQGRVYGEPAVRESVGDLAYAAVRASSGGLTFRNGNWQPHGDPMEVALHVLAMRCGSGASPGQQAHERLRLPFDPRTLRACTLDGDILYVKGAPEPLLALCVPGSGVAVASVAAASMAGRGLRVIAVASLHGATETDAQNPKDMDLLGVVGLLDPPRPDVSDAIAACRRALIKVGMVTGDHPGTARAIAVQTRLSTSDSPLIEGGSLPDDDAQLAALLDHDGIIVARVSPEQKLRIAKVLRQRGHIVAMTGDGVNDAPALREADIGIAMGATGSDVAREAADVVLLDDHFGTIVNAIELGRATFANVRRFLTYHLTDNVAELAPFAAWALTGGAFPLAIGVLQILALDIGTDLLPALALGVEPANPRTLAGPARTGQLIDRRLLTRVFGVLGPAEALVALAAFAAVLLAGGWRWGTQPTLPLLAMASGTTFAAIVLAQMANAFACRSEITPVWEQHLAGNRTLIVAVVAEILALGLFLGLPPAASALGGTWPPVLGWALAAAAIPVVLLTDGIHKRRSHRTAGQTEPRAGGQV